MVLTNLIKCTAELLATSHVMKNSQDILYNLKKKITNNK